MSTAPAEDYRSVVLTQEAGSAALPVARVAQRAAHDDRVERRLLEAILEQPAQDKPQLSASVAEILLDYLRKVPPGAKVEAVARLCDEQLVEVQLQLQRIMREAAFQQTELAWRVLDFWVSRFGTLDRVPTKDELGHVLSREIATIDAMLSQQVNAILHHPRFQRLEASWRGLRYLVEHADGAEQVKIRVLNMAWAEVARDAERAIEFDQSQLFRKVYSEEFGSPGGEPFGLLIGDYEISHRPGPDRPTDDLSVLTSIAHVAAAAFAPFVASAHPSLFGVDRFAELEPPLNLSRSFEQLEYLKWRAFRDSEDSRFVGLAMPHVLMRLPYEDDGSRVDGFRFHEDVEGPDLEKYLWGNAAYAFGAVAVRAFAETGWVADIRGVERGMEAGGLVTGLPVHSFGTDRRGVAIKSSVDVKIGDYQEKGLGEIGFLPLCPCPDSEFAAFYGSHSVQKPKKYDDPGVTVNARLSAMLQHMLCVSRFAHYVKVIGRDKLGAFTEAEQCEDLLHRWIHKYVTTQDDAGPEVKARYPLREAKIQIREQPGKPGSYVCVAHLRPHYQLEELAASVRLVTELSPGRTS